MREQKPTFLVTIEVTNVKWSRPGNDWCVLSCRLDEDPADPDFPAGARRERKLSITGELMPASKGDLLDCEVEVEYSDKFRCWQFKSLRHAPCARRDERALLSFLGRLPNVGPERSVAILSRWGTAEAVFEMLDNSPEDLAKIPGITDERAVEIASTLIELSGERDAWKLCRELKLNSRLTTIIMRQLGGRAREVIHTDPFMLMKYGIQFRDCDDIHRALGGAEDDARRTGAAMLVVLQLALSNGDVWATEKELFGGQVDARVDRRKQQLHVTDDLLREGLAHLEHPLQVGTLFFDPRVVVEDERIYLYEVYEAEQAICDKLSAMLRRVA